MPEGFRGDINFFAERPENAKELKKRKDKQKRDEISQLKSSIAFLEKKLKEDRTSLAKAQKKRE